MLVKQNQLKEQQNMQQSKEKNISLSNPLSEESFHNQNALLLNNNYQWPLLVL